MHQDAHEFWNYLINTIVDLIRKETNCLPPDAASHLVGTGRTFVQDIFEGILTNETRCLNCETVRCISPPSLA